MCKANIFQLDPFIVYGCVMKYAFSMVLLSKKGHLNQYWVFHLHFDWGKCFFLTVTLRVRLAI